MNLAPSDNTIGPISTIAFGLEHKCAINGPLDLILPDASAFVDPADVARRNLSRLATPDPSSTAADDLGAPVERRINPCLLSPGRRPRPAHL